MEGKMHFWQLDETAPLITPREVFGYYRDLMGAAGAGLELPDLLVATFQRQALEHLARSVDAGEIARWPTPVLWPVGRGSIGGREMAVARLPVGAPAATAALELMIAAGTRTVLLVGSAGGISPNLQIGSLIVPSAAIRHEGTSHHYLPPGQPATASGELVQALSSAALGRGFLQPSIGPTWTTDAIYRECVGTIVSLRERGVLAVEMEAAALFAVAAHRGIRAAGILAISDLLGETWTPGFHTMSYRRALVSAADIALDAASQLPAVPSSM
jgi:uridine phosphorylase